MRLFLIKIMTAAVYILLLVTLYPSCAAPEIKAPIESSPPTPASFSISSLDISPSGLMPEDPFSVTCTVRNSGKMEGIYTAVLNIDGQELGKKDISIGSGGTGSATFSAVAPKTGGNYKLSIGEISKTLNEFNWTPIMLQNDQNRASGYWTEYSYGLLSYFQLTASLYNIQKVRIYGRIYGQDARDYQSRNFTIKIWDKTLSKVIWSKDYSYGLFNPTTPNWAELEVPNIRVDGDFSIEVYPNAESLAEKRILKCGLAIGLDTSGTEAHADIIQNGVVQPWFKDYGPRDKAAWMVRVDGQSGPKLERYTLKYDDGQHETGLGRAGKSVMVRFSPPSKPFTIGQIMIYGHINATFPGWENNEFNVKLWHKDAGKELWSGNFKWSLLKATPSWTTLQVPDIITDGDFFVEASSPPGSEENKIIIHIDSSSRNEHSYMSSEGKIIPWEPWTFDGVQYTQEKVNWMIRVVGTSLAPEKQ